MEHLKPCSQLSSPVTISLLSFFAVCTQLLVSRPDEENISSYLQLIDKCLIHEVSGSTSYQTLLTAEKPFPKYLSMETLWFLTHNTEWKSRGQPHGDGFPGALHRHRQGQGAGGVSAQCSNLFAFWRASGPGNGAETFWTAVRGCGRGQLRHSHPVGSEQSSQALISLQAVLRRPLSAPRRWRRGGV